MLFFKDKYNKQIESMHLKNQDYLESQGMERTDMGREDEKLELEKGDLPAIIISAFLTFAPVFLVLGGIVALAWIFLH